MALADVADGELHLVTDVEPVGQTHREREPVRLRLARVRKVRRHLYAQGEMTSQSLWPRCDRHFVGTTRHDTLS